MGKTSLQNPTSSLRVSLRALLPVGLVLVVASICFLSIPAKSFAAAEKTTGTASAANSGTWAALTAQQKQALAPLANDWPQLSPDQKQKWLVFAGKYQQLKPEEQQRVQEKMQAWAKLTPEQRLAARQNYIRSNKLQPDVRTQKWQEYQQLPDEQKAQLANHPEKKTLLTNLPTPAESKEKKLQPLKTPHKPVTAGASSSAPAAPATAITPNVAPAGAPTPSAPANGITQ